MSTYAAQGQTIRSRFFANWATTDIAWPNRKYTPTQGVAWVRLTVRDGNAIQHALLGQRRALGVVLVEIYTVDGTGDGTARTYADSICNIFRRIEVDGILFREPMAYESASQEPGWYRWLCEIEFQADSNPAEPSVSASYPVQLISQSAHGFVVGNFVYASAGTWAKARANSASTLSLGVVVGVPDAGNFKVALWGTANVPSHGFGSAGTKVFLSQVTAGAGTTSAPTTGISQQVATVIDADHLLIQDFAAERLS